VLPTVLTLLVLAADPVAVVNVDDASSNDPVFLSTHSTPAFGTLPLGGAETTIQKFGKLGGKKPLRFAFAANVNDGADELVASRSTVVDGVVSFDLRVFAAPTSLGQKKPKVIGNAKAGDPALVDSILAMGRFDATGDLRDEFVIVRAPAVETNPYRVEIRPLPSKKNVTIGPAILVADLQVVSAGESLIAAFGVPIDSVLGDELVVVRKRVDGVATLEIQSIPAQGALQWLASMELGEGVIGVSPTRIEDDLFGCVVLREVAGVRQIEHHVLGTDLPVSTVSIASTPLSAYPAAFVFGLRPAADEPPPPPPDPFEPQTYTVYAYDAGALLATMNVQASWSEGVAGTKLEGLNGSTVTFKYGAPIGTECSEIEFTPTQFKLILSEVSAVPGSIGTLDLVVPNGTARVCGLTTIPGLVCVIGDSKGPSIGTLKLNTIGGNPRPVQQIIVVAQL